MAIIFHESSKTFHLHNQEISYIFRVTENQQMEQLYYGAKLPDRENFDYIHAKIHRNFAPIGESAADPSFSLTHTKQEYPSFGSGDYRVGAFGVAQENGSHVSNFVYQSHEIYKGKRDILPLPATYVESEGEADSLAVTLVDAVTQTELVLNYTIYATLPVVTRNAKFTQTGAQTIVLDKALSLCMDFADRDYQMVHLSGAWARERYVKVRDVEHGIQSIQSLRGTSSAEHNPFLALKRKDTTEFAGQAYGFSLIYSGNFLAQVEVCTHDTTRVLMGIHPDTFAWELKTGESFQTPEAVMVYSGKGLNGMSQAFHTLYRTRLVRGIYRDKERPVLLNNWEATYFDFNEDKIVEIAEKAKDVGVELFVLDDGWFGDRDDDFRALGDWFVHEKKLPNGISGLAKRVNDMGMKFGLWIEPEMVNPDSCLYREHPDWVLATPDRYNTLIRNQQVLDYSNPAVVDHIYDMLHKIISTADISYIKWDMNRYLTEVYSSVAQPNTQKQVYHRFILGVYDLYNRLTTKFPEILFESCSGGGARFDPGILFYAPQTWCSDCTDAADRLNIQYGTSMVYPVSAMGAHVSAVPNHQLERTTPLSMRGNVAFFGDFGYELDLNTLTAEEIQTVKEQIIYYKANRKLLHGGTFHRMLSPFDDMRRTAWMVVDEQKKNAIVAYYQTINQVNSGTFFLKMQGLEEEKMYSIAFWGNPNKMLCQETQFSGAELMEIGIPFDRATFAENIGDYASVLINVTQQ